MKSYRKQQLRRLRVYFILDAKKRSQFLKKKNIFKNVGENFFFQPRMLPNDPKLILFHNNDVVASNVTFINHDIIDLMLNNLNENVWFQYKTGCIEIMDNVFIGANSTILSNVKIGPNAIVAAGSVVTKDVPENTVVAGNPAKVIGTFDNFVEKRKKNNNDTTYNYENDEEMWRMFYENHK